MRIRLIKDDSGVSTVIGFMFILAAITIYVSTAYPAMIKKDIKNAETDALSNIRTKMLQFSDDMQSAREGQTSFQLTTAQKYSSTSTAGLVLSPGEGSLNISTSASGYSLAMPSGLITITPKNLFAENTITSFQLGAVIEQQDKKYWSGASSLLSNTGRNVKAQVPVITGNYSSFSGGVKTLKYNIANIVNVNDTNTNAAIVIGTPYPDVFKDAMQNDMNRAGFVRNTDYTLTSTANSVTLNLYNLDSINIKIIVWSVT
jgi:hypothetical protein